MYIMANLISLSAYKLVVMYTQQINYLNGQKSGARVFWRNVNIIVSLVHRPSIKDSELLVLPYIPLLFLQLFVSTSYYIICACVCSCCSESTMPYITHIIGTYTFHAAVSVTKLALIVICHFTII